MISKQLIFPLIITATISANGCQFNAGDMSIKISSPETIHVSDFRATRTHRGFEQYIVISGPQPIEQKVVQQQQIVAPAAPVECEQPMATMVHEKHDNVTLAAPVPATFSINIERKEPSLALIGHSVAAYVAHVATKCQNGFARLRTTCYAMYASCQRLCAKVWQPSSSPTTNV